LELEKVAEAQAKRKTIKSIRQEAFNMAHLRAKKAAEYKMLKMTADVRNKEERCAAIKKGFFALDHMRNRYLSQNSFTICHMLYAICHMPYAILHSCLFISISYPILVFFNLLLYLCFLITISYSISVF
jgi:hypothetical protein